MTLGAGATAGRQDRTEVQVVREDYVPGGAGEGQDLPVGCAGIAQRGPVGGLEPHRPEGVHPARRQVHVDEELQGLPSGSSSSSARQAAYSRACGMSPSSRYG